MTATQTPTTPDAVTRAKAILDPTSIEEDARFIASLIHSLGIQVRKIEYEAIANDRPLEGPFFEINATANGVDTHYIDDDAGEATIPDTDKRVKSIRQQIAVVGERIEALWDKAAADELRPNVKKALEKLQEASVKKMDEEATE